VRQVGDQTTVILRCTVNQPSRSTEPYFMKSRQRFWSCERQTWWRKFIKLL